MDNYSPNVLVTEFELWQEHCKTNEPNEISMLKNAIDALNLCDKDISSNVHTRLKIFSTLPVSTSTAERSFSTLRRIM